MGKGLQIELPRRRCNGNGLQIERPRNGNGLLVDPTPRKYRRIPINDQDTKSVLCGYYCLYFLKRLNEGYQIYDILYKDFDYKILLKMKI